MPIEDGRKREYDRDRHRRRRLRRAGLSESRAEKKVIFSLRLPEAVVARIVRLTHEGIANHTHSWKSPGETGRALIMKGLESLKGHPTIDEMLPYLKLTEQFDVIASNRREAQAGLSRAINEISELLGIGAKQEALQYYHVTLVAAQEMPPTVWRDWMIAELKHQFPQLDKLPAPGVTLRQEPPSPEVRVAHKRGDHAVP